MGNGYNYDLKMTEQDGVFKIKVWCPAILSITTVKVRGWKDDMIGGTVVSCSYQFCPYRKRDKCLLGSRIMTSAAE